jgi:hypothetical protein
MEPKVPQKKNKRLHIASRTTRPEKKGLVRSRFYIYEVFWVNFQVSSKDIPKMTKFKYSALKEKLPNTL